eukprot:TRINITY_DN121455_c0_g1_i1.p1 TRINITY_DN121455_c0_g1~~TRINITY_DN121455_c0_g1_i1.p1  ORF type:complete len:402 (+),score=113.65 TRINITY_DN121455_c0_g1_i1:216-1421(+)
MKLQRYKVAPPCLVAVLLLLVATVPAPADGSSAAEGFAAIVMARSRAAQAPSPKPAPRHMRREGTVRGGSGFEGSELATERSLAADALGEAAAGVEKLLQPPAPATGKALATQFMKLEVVESGLAAAERKWKSLLQVTEEEDPYSRRGEASSAGAALRAEAKWEALLDAELAASTAARTRQVRSNLSTWLQSGRQHVVKRRQQQQLSRRKASLILDSHGAALSERTTAHLTEWRAGDEASQTKQRPSLLQQTPAIDAAVLAAMSEAQEEHAGAGSSYASFLASTGTAVVGIVAVLGVAGGGYLTYQKVSGPRSLAERLNDIPAPGASTGGAEVWKTSKARQTYRKSVLEAQQKTDSEDDDDDQPAPVRKSGAESGGSSGGPAAAAPKQTYRDRMKEKQAGQ